MEGQSVEAPGRPRCADHTGPLAGRQPGMSGRVGEVLLGPRIVQPQGVPGRRQLVGLEEPLEDQIAPVAQIHHTTVGNSHRRRPLDASPASLKSDCSIVHMCRVRVQRTSIRRTRCAAIPMARICRPRSSVPREFSDDDARTKPLERQTSGSETRLNDDTAKPTPHWSRRSVPRSLERHAMTGHRPTRQRVP